MPLSRLLLPLCGLLLALAVTAATASAPLYGPGEVSVSGTIGYTSLTRDEQIAKCKDLGGSLVPMVTEAVYALVTTEMKNSRICTTFSYMGGSTMLSSEKCTTSTASLDCIWSWDQGRYEGADNAIAFYTGNRDSSVLTGAGMINETGVANHWRVISDNARCPCDKLQRYGAFLCTYQDGSFWSDSDSTSYSYSGSSGTLYSLCATSSPVPTTTTTTTTLAPTTTTTTVEPVEENSGVNVPLVVGLSVTGAIIFIIIVAVALKVLCFAAPSVLAGASGGSSGSSTLTGSRLGSLSRGSSFNSSSSLNSRSSSFKSQGSTASSRISSLKSRGSSRRASSKSQGSETDDADTSSFDERAGSKNGSSRYSDSQGFEDDASSRRSDEETDSTASSRSGRG